METLALKLTSKEKTELEVLHFLELKRMLHLRSKQNSTRLSIFARFDINFVENT